MMSTHKPSPQYGTLDVLLMLLLFHSSRVVKIPNQVFNRYSCFFAHRRISGVVVSKSGRDTEIVTLKRTSKKLLRPCIVRYLSLYNHNKVLSPETRLNVRFWRFLMSHSVRHAIYTSGEIVFSFATQQFTCSCSVSDFPTLDLSSHLLALYYAGWPTKGILGVGDNGKMRLIVEVDINDLLGHIGFWNGWRVRWNSPVASYMGQPISFKSSSNKQKKLLDLLVAAKNGVRKTDDVIKELSIDDTNRRGEKDKEFACARIREIGREIRKKAQTACKNIGIQKPGFTIEVDADYTRIVNTSPI